MILSANGGVELWFDTSTVASGSNVFLFSVAVLVATSAGDSYPVSVSSAISFASFSRTALIELY